MDFLKLFRSVNYVQESTWLEFVFGGDQICIPIWIRIPDANSDFEKFYRITNRVLAEVCTIGVLSNFRLKRKMTIITLLF